MFYISESRFEAVWPRSSLSAPFAESRFDAVFQFAAVRSPIAADRRKHPREPQTETVGMLIFLR